MTLQTLTRLSRCSQTLSISFFGSNPHFLSSFFTLNILFILLCLLFPFARRKTIYCLQCLYIWKKKNHNAPFSHLISPFLTSNVINTLLFFFYPETEILKCLNIFRTCQSVCLIRIYREKKDEDIFLKTGLHRSSWSSTLNTTMKSLSQFKESN